MNDSMRGRKTRVQTLPSQLKDIFQRRQATIMPGTPTSLYARVIEKTGFDCAYVTGAGIANMSLGVPDIGLVTLTELADHVRSICSVVSIPVLVDCDTGFGNAINVRRTVQMIEAAGAAGCQLEDQVFPKKCGHFAGKAIIPADEMVQKIHAAVDARRDGDFQIVARTDALAVSGLNEALDRAHMFVEAGADVTFVEAPTNMETIRKIVTEIDAPQVLNLVHGGLTPSIPHDELKEMGFGTVLYANAALQGALQAVTRILASLKEHGSLEKVKDQLASFELRQESVEKGFFDDLESKYRS
jgi:2-methylisocitrate lyase-like PEP mutase family enzyme